MGGAALTDGRTGNGVFLASLDHFESESRTPTGQGAGCLMLARFSCVTLLACYFPQLKAKAAFFGRCLELACQHHTPATTLLISGLSPADGACAPIPDLPSSPRNGEVRTRGCVRTPYPDENEQFHCSGSRAAEFFALP